MLLGRSEPDVVRIRRDTGGPQVVVGHTPYSSAGATAVRPRRDIMLAVDSRIQEQTVAVVVVDAPVIMQLEFQQSFLFMFLEVPQIQFKMKVPDIPVV